VDHESVTQGLIVRIALGVFGLLTVAVLVLAVFNDKGVIQVHAQSSKLTAIDTEVEQIVAENKELTKEIQRLRTDPSMIEQLAREELKLVKPGEVVLVNPEK
jgi:cell division protein FtsB